MNGLTLYKSNDNNIFKERIEEFMMFYKSLNSIMKQQKFTLIRSSKEDSDPTMMTKCYKFDYKHDETGEITSILIPIPDRNLAFVINGVRWIPIFQVTDIPIYMKNNICTFYNNYCAIRATSVTPETAGYMTIGVNQIPLIYILFDITKSIEKVCNDLHLDYEKIDLPSASEIQKLMNSNDGYIYIPLGHLGNDMVIKTKFTDNILINELLYPFMKEYRNDDIIDKISQYDFENDEVYSRYFEIIISKTSKISQIIDFASIIDYISFTNGIFDHPVSLYEVIVDYYNKGSYVENRNINNLEKRRIRLGEYLLQKLAQHHRNALVQASNPKKSVSKKPYMNIILDMLAVDNRRQLDDSLNPVSELSIMSRLTYGGYGGVDKETCNPATRNLDDTHWERVDPMDSPAGESQGIVLHLVPEISIKTGIIEPVREDIK